MNNSIRVILILSFFAVTLFAVLGRSSEIDSGFKKPKDQIILRIAEHHSPDHPVYQGVQAFVEKVEEDTEGAVRILIYEGNVLGDEASVVEQVSFGGVEFAVVSGIYLDKYSDMMTTICSPGLYEDKASMMKVLRDDDIRSELVESLKYEKINILTIYPDSHRGVYHNEPNMEWLMGQKIAVPESQMKIRELESMGFQTVPADRQSVSSYIASGYVEGAEGDLMDYYIAKDYGKAGVFTLTESLVPEVFIASNSAMKQLTVAQQSILMKAAEEAGMLIYESVNAYEAEILESLRQQGVVINKISDSETYEKRLLDHRNDTADLELLKRIKALDE